jgi:hypothetical protein
LRTWNSAPAASSSYADSLTSSIFQVLTDYVLERRLFLADQGLEHDNGRYLVTQPGIYGIFYNQRCDGCGTSYFRLAIVFNGIPADLSMLAQADVSIASQVSSILTTYANGFIPRCIFSNNSSL